MNKRNCITDSKFNQYCYGNSDCVTHGGSDSSDIKVEGERKVDTNVAADTNKKTGMQLPNKVMLPLKMRKYT